MSEFKPKQIFEQPLKTSLDSQPSNAQRLVSQENKFVPQDNQFVSQENKGASQENVATSHTFSATEQHDFVPVVNATEHSLEGEPEQQLERQLRSSGRWRWAAGIATAFTLLLGWQAVDSVLTAVQQQDWLSLGWSALIAGVAALGITTLGKEWWKLRRLRRHFSVQEQSEALLQKDSVGQGQAFCQQLAQTSGIETSSAAYQRWQRSVQATHSDAEVLDLYDALVVAEQDRCATKIVSACSTEAAALVALSPLAIADMLLVAWRNLRMLDQLAQVYGVELGYWARIRLLKLVFVNMALAGASELAIDAGMDLLSVDLAGRLSARAGQGLGVGILTARLGLKAMALLRPLPWQRDRTVKLSTIRKQIIAKVTALTLK